MTRRPRFQAAPFRNHGDPRFALSLELSFEPRWVALVIAAVQDRPAAEVAAMDVAAELAPFDLKNQLSSNRTQGVPNMIALVQAHAARLAGGVGANGLDGVDRARVGV